MSAEERILQGIIDDANLQAEKIIAEAKSECENILAKGKEEAKAYSAKTVSDALRRAKAIKQNADSAAELSVRDIKLAKKHEEIEKTLCLAIEKIISLPDEKYFSLLCELAVKNARSEEGVICLGPADLIRDIAVFERLLSKHRVNVTLEKTPYSVKNGFVLKYGDIEYNLSLDAVIADKKDTLQDSINSILFED